MSRLDDPELPGRLIAAAHELLAAARELQASAMLEHGAGAGGNGTSNDGRAWLGTARRIYRDRRRRDELFRGTHLFGEPAWDILLDLFIAGVENKRISITSACIGAAAPPTTALRWLNILERGSLIEREGDSNDMRRSYVRLSGRGFAQMMAFFSSRAVAHVSDISDPPRHSGESPERLARAVGSAAVTLPEP